MLLFSLFLLEKEARFLLRSRVSVSHASKNSTEQKWRNFPLFWSIKFFSTLSIFFLSSAHLKRDEHLRLFLGGRDDAVVSILLSPRSFVIKIVGWFFARTKRFGDESEKKRDDDEDDDEEKRIFFCDE